MPAVDGNVIIGYANGAEPPKWSYLGNFVEDKFTQNANSIITVDGATERVPLDTQDLKILSMNERGIVDYTKITGVTRYTLANDLDWSIFYVNGLGLAGTADTYIGNRQSDPPNVISGQLITTFSDGDLVASSVHRHTIGVTELANDEWTGYNDDFPVPRIVTANWGELAMSRNDARMFIDFIPQHPDDLDQSDVEVFNRVVDENTVYVYIGKTDNIRDNWIESQMPKKMYYIETESGTFNTSFGYCVGTPVALLQSTGAPKTAQQPSKRATISPSELLAKHGKKSQ
jgi:hypothetical protein